MCVCVMCVYICTWLYDSSSKESPRGCFFYGRVQIPSLEDWFSESRMKHVNLRHCSRKPTPGASVNCPGVLCFPSMVTHSTPSLTTPVWAMLSIPVLKGTRPLQKTDTQFISDVASVFSNIQLSICNYHDCICYLGLIMAPFLYGGCEDSVCPMPVKCFWAPGLAQREPLLFGGCLQWEISSENHCGPLATFKVHWHWRGTEFESPKFPRNRFSEQCY